MAGVAVGIALFAVVLQVAGPRSSENAADATFELSASLAGAIERDGPLLFQDLLGGTRDIFVQHLGGDNWTAFEARRPGAPPECVLAWHAGERQFRDPCDGSTFPADGTGLVSFPTTVDGGRGPGASVDEPVPDPERSVGALRAPVAGQ